MRNLEVFGSLHSVARLAREKLAGAIEWWIRFSRRDLGVSAHAWRRNAFGHQ
jgi:hypothetical protein